MSLPVIQRDGLVLDLKSQMLFRNSICFVNGEIHAGMDGDLPAWRELANQRRLAGQEISDGMIETLCLVSVRMVVARQSKC